MLPPSRCSSQHAALRCAVLSYAVPRCAVCCAVCCAALCPAAPHPVQCSSTSPQGTQAPFFSSFQKPSSHQSHLSASAWQLQAGVQAGKADLAPAQEQQGAAWQRQVGWQQSNCNAAQAATAHSEGPAASHAVPVAPGGSRSHPLLPPPSVSGLPGAVLEAAVNTLARGTPKSPPCPPLAWRSA